MLILGLAVGFTGERISLDFPRIGAALGAATGVIFSACYALWLYRKVVFGALTKESLEGMLDLSAREKLILYPLVALVIFFGVYPAPILDRTGPAVEALVTKYDTALAAAGRTEADTQVAVAEH